MGMRNGQTGVSNQPVIDDTDDGQSEFDAIVGAMGGGDDDGGPPQGTGEAGNRGAAQGNRLPTQQEPRQPAQQPNTQPNTQGQGQAVDAQTAQIRLQQYEQTYIPQLNRRLQEAEQQVAQLRQTQQGVEQYTSLMTQFGLKPDEAQVGLQMAAAYRRNPVEFLKGLINTTRAAGADLSSLGVQAGLDPGSLAMVIDQKLKPIMDHFQGIRQQTEQEQRAERELQQFFASYPDAYLHQDDIATIMSQTGYDNVRAYWELKSWAMQKGFDWSKPLVPQLQAAQGQGNGQQQGNGFPATRRSNSYNTPVNHQEQEEFDVNVGWKDAIRQVASAINGA